VNSELLIAANLSVAGLLGLAVGFERERTGHTDGPDARFAGVRTFLMFGLLGGVAGHFVANDRDGVGAAMLVSGGALSVVAYALAVRRPGATPDGTTETAALLVLALAAMAGAGHRSVAAGAGTLVVAALVGKQQIRGVLDRLGEQELWGALQFAVLALVILPLLPNITIGPWGGVNPRALWIVVLIFCGVNYGGFLLQRWVGASRGYAAMGMLGGLVSSTAVTLQFSRQSRAQPARSAALGLGIVAACTVLVLRVTVVATVINGAMLRALTPYLAPPLLLGTIVIAIVLIRQAAADAGHAPAALTSPLRLGTALQLAVAFQVAMFAIQFSRDAFGSPGVLTSAFLLGLTDMDALTFSMARLGTTPAGVSLGAEAIAVGMIANTLLKLILVLTLGRGELRRLAAIGLAAIGVACGAGMWIARM
jgi:uncharacterized membrane protein (DUF4010 family)